MPIGFRVLSGFVCGGALLRAVNSQASFADKEGLGPIDLAAGRRVAMGARRIGLRREKRNKWITSTYWPVPMTIRW